MARLSIMLVAAVLATIAGLNSRTRASDSPQDGDPTIRASLADNQTPANETESSMQAARFSPLQNGLIEWIAKFKATSIGAVRWSLPSETSSATVDAQLAHSVSPNSLQVFAVRLQI